MSLAPGRPLQRFRQDRLHVFDPQSPPLALLEGMLILERVLALWQGWRGDRVAPLRNDIDPIALGNLLPNIFLLDVLADDFRFRLVGEAVNGRYNHRLKGRTLRGLLTGNALEETLTEHRLCSQSMKAVLVRNSLDHVTNDDAKVYTRLLLPVAAGAGPTAAHILGAMEFRG